MTQQFPSPFNPPPPYLPPPLSPVLSPVDLKSKLDASKRPSSRLGNFPATFRFIFVTYFFGGGRGILFCLRRKINQSTRLVDAISATHQLKRIICSNDSGDVGLLLTLCFKRPPS